MLAVGSVSMARELGLRVPDDLSVTGFDDIQLAEVVGPRVTTIHVPRRRMGEAAARALFAIRDGTTECRSVELDTQFIMR